MAILVIVYGNISHRVMCTIEDTWPHVEIYSIDEAFLDLSSLSCDSHGAFCDMLQKKILQHTGIPTSIGIGPTKPLAKIANHLCKEVLKVPVLELQGIDCGGIEEIDPKQSIMSSKSFGQMQTEFGSIAESISSHCDRSVEKMRSQGLVAQRIVVFVHTNRFRKDLAQHFQSMEFCLVNATDDLRLITKIAKRCLGSIFRPGYYYKKAGVCLLDLIPQKTRQLDMFHQPTDEQLDHTEKLMSVLDKVNQKYGRSTIRLAAEGYSKPWAMRAELKSPAYTTRWSDGPKVSLY